MARNSNITICLPSETLDWLDANQPADESRADIIRAALDSYRGTESVVYFLEDCERGHLKIGFSRHLGARVQHLQTQTKAKLVLRRIVPGGRQEEAGYHQRFAAHLVRGREWFMAGPVKAELGIGNEVIRTRGEGITLSVPFDLLDLIEVSAREAGISRAAWVKQACEEKLRRGSQVGTIMQSAAMAEFEEQGIEMKETP